MRKIGVTAAALVLAFSIGFAARGADGNEGAARHFCSATDKDFIRTATTDMTQLGIWAASYKEGNTEPGEVVREARAAAKRVGYIEPRDPSLQKAQRFMSAMFLEYGEAVDLYAKGEKAGDRMYRAYGLANFAREVLVDAEPALAAQGCDVSPLL